MNLWKRVGILWRTGNQEKAEFVEKRAAERSTVDLLSLVFLWCERRNEKPTFVNTRVSDPALPLARGEAKAGVDV